MKTNQNNRNQNICSESGYHADALSMGLKLGEFLGEGGFGKVYALPKSADHDLSKRDYCVKIMNTNKMLTDKDRLMLPLMSPAFVRKYHHMLERHLLNEVTVMEILAGEPNIVQIEGYSCWGSSQDESQNVAIRMERLTCLTAYADTHPFNRDMVIRLGMDLCRALMACEKFDIVHQDIKAANIFIDTEGAFKLGDFGIAARKNRMQAGKPSRTGGSISTLSPEIYEGRTADDRSDIYSLGMVMYWFMNRQRDPYICSDEEQSSSRCRAHAFLRRMQEKELPVPVLCSSDDPLLAIIRKACAHSPENRYADAGEMYRELEKCCG